MPVYHFRLEAVDGSGHKRTGGVFAESTDEAEQILLPREAEYTIYRLTTAEIEEYAKAHGEAVVKAALEAKGKAKMPSELTAKARAEFAIHRQEKPYRLANLKEAVS
jgi:hypothetical protein